MDKPVKGWVRPMGDDGLIGRAHMPQIDDADIPTLLSYLGSFDIGFKAGLIDPKEVRSHQDINQAKAATMPAKYLKTPSIISRDPIVIDGNHRWFRHLTDGSMMPFIQIEEDFDTAMRFIMTFPKTYEETK